MSILILGLLVFFSAHLYSAFRPRTAGADIKQRIGENKYMGLYSLVSVAGLALIVWGYSRTAPSEYLLMPMSGGAGLGHYLMMVSFVCLTASNMPMGYLKHTLKHPMLIGVSLWAIAHLIDGANLRQILLFGSFLLYSIIDVVAVSLRDNGASEKSAAPKWSFDLLSIAVGLIFYYLFAHYLHEWLFGFNPHLAGH